MFALASSSSKTTSRASRTRTRLRLLSRISSHLRLRFRAQMPYVNLPWRLALLVVYVPSVIWVAGLTFYTVFVRGGVGKNRSTVAVRSPSRSALPSLHSPPPKSPHPFLPSPTHTNPKVESNRIESANEARERHSAYVPARIT